MKVNKSQIIAPNIKVKGGDPKKKLAEAQLKVKEFSEKFGIPRSEWTYLEDLYCIEDEDMMPFVREIQYQAIEKYGVTRAQIKAWANGEDY